MSNSKVLRKQARLDLLAEFLTTAESRLEYLHESAAKAQERLYAMTEEERTEASWEEEQLTETTVKESAVLELIKELEKLL